VKDFFFVELEDQHSLRELLSPLESLIVPVYFVFIGMQVKLETFAEPKTLWIAAGLTVAAVIGKLVSGFVCSPSLKRWVVGIAMMPRGEVGLIFASIGRSLGAVDDATFSAVVAMVMVTTFLASPLLKWSLKSGGSGESRVQKPA
jgi:Kef-type K+ transport system membrane component KefB